MPVPEAAPRGERGAEEAAAAEFSFALVADVQYADHDDGFNYAKTRMRYYRGTLDRVSECTEVWRTHPTQPEFLLQLGDIIDGHCSREGAAAGAATVALERVVTALDAAQLPIHHVWGNHELYNFSKADLLASAINSQPQARAPVAAGPGPADQRDEPAYYYEFSRGRVRFLCYDAYDVGLLGRPKTAASYKRAMTLLNEHNPNESWNNPDGLVGLERRFVGFNGGIGERQLAWMRRTLEDASRQQQMVVLNGHVPISPGAAASTCLLWNYQEVLDLLHEFDCVVACFSGHDHLGGYDIDEAGIHFCVLPALLECAAGETAHGIASVFPDRLELTGFGKLASRRLDLDRTAALAQRAELLRQQEQDKEGEKSKGTEAGETL